MAEPVERRENLEQRVQLLISLGHAGRQHAQRNIWIVLEEGRHDGRAQRRAQGLVEIVLDCERALPRGRVTRIQRRLRITLFERGDDAGRIGDRPALQEQDRQFALPGRAPGADQVVRAEHLAAVSDALVIERPAHLLVVVRQRDVPQQRSVHRARVPTSRCRTG